MISRITSAAIRVGRSQLLGLWAQVLGATPVIAMSIYLAHAVGLEAVADYAALIGVSAVVYTLGMVGLRSRLVLDRFRDFAEEEYYTLRIIAASVMMLLILVSGPLLGASLMLTLAVALMRFGDAALDLVMALDQVRRDDRAHMYGYIQGSSAKLVLLLVLLVLAEVTGLLAPFAAFALASAMHAIYAWAMLQKRRQSRAALFSTGRAAGILRLLRNSAVFAVAQILCALLTSAPRVALTAISDRDLAGAAAAALSVATLIGMAYFAVWLRWVSRFGKDRLRLDHVMTFVTEMAVMLLLILGSVWVAGRSAMELVYGISLPSHLDLALWTLMSCAIFFFIMTLANLFKPTRLPWAESAAYIGGLGALWLSSMWQPDPSIPALLLAGALGMVLVEIPLFAVLLLRRRMEKVI